jgi:hypothetical protein
MFPSHNLQTLLEEFDFILSLHTDELSEEALPWASGAVAVKKALDRKHGSRNRASSVIARMGGIKDPQKRKVRDQVLSLYRQEGATIKQMERDKKAKKRGGVSSTSKKTGEKVPQESPKDSLKTQEAKVVKPSGSKPNLKRLLGKKSPSKLSSRDKKIITKIAPHVEKRAETFCEKHPVLTKMTKGAVVGGVCGLAAAAAIGALTGGVGMAVPAVMAVGGQVAAKGALVGTMLGYNLGITDYFSKNVDKSDTVANRHPHLTKLGM